MGKWTPNYTDNVLHTKISALITGAINRAAVEKEPTITYEDFVHELDTGDAFTTSLIDILVKELAERHTRPCQHDERKFIAPRTMERLRSLANPRQVYQGELPGSRNHARRRTINLSEFMSAPSGEADMDDDDNDYGNFLDASAGAAEGARLDTDFFVPYDSRSWSPFARRLGTTPSPPIEDDAPVWRPVGTLNTWAPVPTSNSTSSASLTRHASIRRPTRSRMVDFHDWTSRRRSTVRDGVGTQVEPPESSSSLLAQSSGGEASQTIRRFFPTFGRRQERRLDLSEDRPGDGPLRSDVSLVSLHPSSTRDVVQPGSSSPETRSVANGTNEVDRPLPRLRRGGVRPPEMMWTPHSYAWPASNSSSRPASASASIDSNTDARLSLLSNAEHPRPSPPPRESDAGSSATDPVQGYPTPSSEDNEPASV